MRILIISGEYPPVISGMGDYARQLAVHLNAQGHKVIVMTAKNGPNENQDGIEILRQMESWDYGARETLKTALKIWNPDIVHLQYMSHTFRQSLFTPFLPFFIKSWFPQMKVMTTFHEFAAPFNRLALLPLLYCTDAAIVTNQHHLRLLSKLMRALWLKKPVHKIPLAANILPPADYKENRAVVREQLGASQEDILLVRFGILHDFAVPQLLKWFKIFAKLRQEQIPVKLLLMGKGELPAKNRLAEELQRLDLQDHVQIKTDLASDIISAYLHASDIGIALYPDGISEKRTASLALFAHELPVIALRKQPLPAEFRDGENLLCLPADAKDEAWMDAVKRLITDSALRQKLVQGTHEITAIHDWTHIAKMTEQAYLSLK
jgi:glycosyltransferase involved in cell wall biosynthesis